MRKSIFYLLIVCSLVGCQESIVSYDSHLKTSFSNDTISFDTVFTTIGSATQQLKLYNPNKNALKIERIWLNDGKYFHINVDGESNLAMCQDMIIHGGDSISIFVKVNINPQNSLSPVRIEDRLNVAINGSVSSVLLEAYGQDVHLIRTRRGRTEALTRRFENDKPYLIYDTIIANNIQIAAGARLYMHQGASIVALHSLTAVGTKEQPISIRGDRLDNLFDSVPYKYAAGAWGGIYLQQEKQKECTCKLDYVDILSGNIGLYCIGESTSQLPEVSIYNSRIHNHAAYGLVFIRTNATVVNTEISNCASYCIYLQSGKQEFIHSTIASFFNATNIAVQSTGREDLAAVFIDNLSKQQPETNASFKNCIITGVRKNQLVVATPFTRYYPGEFIGNFLKTDTLPIPHARANTYYTDSLDTIPIFRNEYYKYKEYNYYDFQLDSLSPAIAIADSAIASEYPADRLGNNRHLGHPDAGCYQH